MIAAGTCKHSEYVNERGWTFQGPVDVEGGSCLWRRLRAEQEGKRRGVSSRVVLYRLIAKL